MIDIMYSGMIALNQEVSSMSNKITISLSSMLINVLDQLACQWATTRSGAVAELLRRIKQEEIEKELAEGYAVLSEVNRKEAEVTISAQSEVVLHE
ncbi:MAG TPA: CopG family transcriptional regulator [Desulfotomaculum sp.]|nr:MAG: Putative CopG-like DNA-binding protein [Desulfotomaculum sp. 46_80]HAG11418.1 CopG family transcriptional regulator [Desulfotomaculum sp.]HBY05156.1 CopG family transcriptional regulator [Desulfotomaculum sp.]